MPRGIPSVARRSSWNWTQTVWQVSTSGAFHPAPVPGADPRQGLVVPVGVAVENVPGAPLAAHSSAGSPSRAMPGSAGRARPSASRRGRWRRGGGTGRPDLSVGAGPAEAAVDGRNSACAAVTASRAPTRSSSTPRRRSFSTRPSSETYQPSLPAKAARRRPSRTLRGPAAVRGRRAAPARTAPRCATSRRSRGRAVCAARGRRRLTGRAPLDHPLVTRLGR